MKSLSKFLPIQSFHFTEIKAFFLCKRTLSKKHVSRDMSRNMKLNYLILNLLTVTLKCLNYFLCKFIQANPFHVLSRLGMGWSCKLGNSTCSLIITAASAGNTTCSYRSEASMGLYYSNHISLQFMLHMDRPKHLG